MTTLINSGFIGNGGVNTLQQLADCTGADYLRVWVYAEGGVSVTSLVRGAQNPSFITGSSITDTWQGAYDQVSPTTGSVMLTVNFSGNATRCLLYWSAWSGVDPSTPSGTPATAAPEGASPLTIATPSGAGDIIEAVCMAVADTLTLDTSGGAVEIEQADDWESVFRSFGAAYEATEDASISWTPSFATDGYLVGIPIIASGGPTGPSITNVDTDDTITSTQTGWNVNGNEFDTATVDIIQGSTTVAQDINSQNATTINCDTVFDAGVGPHLKYGNATLEVTNGDAQSDTIVISIATPTGVSYVDVGTPNTTAANRITAVPDIASGDQLEISSVVGGAISDVTVYTDATFDCALSVTAFTVRCWDAGDSTWGDAGVQTVTGDEENPPTFEGTIPTQSFTQDADIGTVNFSTYFASVSSYALNQALPDGLSFNTTNAALTGIPTEAGTFGGFVITATNAFGTADSNAFTISVASNQEFASGGRARDGRTRGFMSYIWGRG